EMCIRDSGSIEAAVVDTLHFKGNYPESCSIQAAFVEGGNEARIEAQSLFWRELLPAQKLEMHHEHRFERQLNALGPVSHVRLNIFPDGGVSRLRLFGRPQLP
ncbi:allantoicase, partial [Pseudomonas aeruginosa]|nr:allantoicase [Pseudomonas aeruginosa]